MLVALLALASLGVVAYRLAADGNPGSDRPAGPGRREAAAARIDPRPAQRAHLVERRTGALPAPLQDAAAASINAHGALLLGGLTAADTSTDTILLAGAGGAHRQGVLPFALHDSAAVQLGGSTYLFGGGTASRQLDTIVRISAAGATAAVGRLPSPSSDQAAAGIAGTAYVIGGYTGSRWLDTIVAWRPGEAARVVAHLPVPVRYAAVTAVGNGIVIAGGSLPNGSASDAVLEYRPTDRRVVRIGRLPAPTTHAAAASLGGVAYIVGGRGAIVGSATARVVAVELGSGRIRRAGRLATPRSDLAAAAVGTRILLAGGHGPTGTESTISELVPGARRAATVSAARVPVTPAGNVYAYDRANMLAPAARAALPRIYVPNSQSATVDVIDPRRFKVVEHFAVGALPQHVTPAYDLRTLYVTNDLGNSLTPIDP